MFFEFNVAREVLWKGAFEGVFLVEESEINATRVEEMAREGDGLFFVASGAVEAVAEDWMSNAGQVDANLVRSAGARLHFDEIGIVWKRLKNGIVGNGLASGASSLVFGGDDGLACAVTCSGDWRINRALLWNDMTGDKGDVGFVNASSAKEFFERLVSLGGFG